MLQTNKRSMSSDSSSVGLLAIHYHLRCGVLDIPFNAFRQRIPSLVEKSICVRTKIYSIWENSTPVESISTMPRQSCEIGTSCSFTSYIRHLICFWRDSLGMCHPTVKANLEKSLASRGKAFNNEEVAFTSPTYSKLRIQRGSQQRP
mmetsp:Transcript_10437/g.28860  ORF Transcript_10437/g.28860 Transcript_10437/m.28860 type:complete len:147 (+) Transcript_10437:45-485(+)